MCRWHILCFILSPFPLVLLTSTISLLGQDMLLSTRSPRSFSVHLLPNSSAPACTGDGFIPFQTLDTAHARVKLHDILLCSTIQLVWMAALMSKSNKNGPSISPWGYQQLQASNQIQCCWSQQLVINNHKSASYWGAERTDSEQSVQ